MFFEFETVSLEESPLELALFEFKENKNITSDQLIQFI
ncbi:hypothetical protein CPS_1220 [Colwellia psychrerythraea 34H]|uniref:Uncharacterized protein n=1 Tax=Colwellia psychrerythraea (strain 34H / ATCC BAA-681) TaxID=167879 RepID=Q486Q2_COLP3|nr:hypothetical protein CPS_1220 [Colwellia psychrerythraea 34H]